MEILRQPKPAPAPKFYQTYTGECPVCDCVVRCDDREVIKEGEDKWLRKPLLYTFCPTPECARSAVRIKVSPEVRT